jgi:hypothetical protein
MAKNLILVHTKKNILNYDNRKAIELSQQLGRPLNAREYKTLKLTTNQPQKLIFKNKAYFLKKPASK